MKQKIVEQKPPNLTVHKNTLEKHRRKALGKTMVGHARQMANEPDLAGYLIISWDKEATPNTAWRADKDSPVPGNLLPVYAMSTLTRVLSNKDVQYFLSGEE